MILCCQFLLKHAKNTRSRSTKQSCNMISAIRLAVVFAYLPTVYSRSLQLGHTHRGLSQDSPKDHRSLTRADYLTQATSSLHASPRLAQHAPQPLPAALIEADA